MISSMSVGLLDVGLVGLLNPSFITGNLGKGPDLR